MKISTASILLLVIIFASCQQEQLPQDESLVASHVIIGQDDRVPTEPYSSPLNRRVGQLIGKQQEGNQLTTCTGVVVGRNHILTAAHCLYDGQGRALKNIFFYPDIRKRNTMPRGRFAVVRAYHPKDYTPLVRTLRNVELDMALVEVALNEKQKNLQEEVGVVGFWGVSDLPSSVATTIGYPNDKEISVQHGQERCHIDSLSEQALKVDCDVFQGQSGSPLFIYSDQYENHHIHGVISSEDHLNKVNYVTRITPLRQRVIQELVAGTYVAKAQDREIWIESQVLQETRARVLVKNDCLDKNVLYAITYGQMMDRTVDMKGFFLIKHGETVEIFETPASNIRVLVVNESGGRVISGEHLYNVPGNEGKFGFREITGLTAQDKTLTVMNCGG